MMFMVWLRDYFHGFFQSQ